MAKTFENLEAWQQAIKLAKSIYLLTNKYPQKEVFGITSQMRRAAVSISSNIAEGSAKQSTKEFIYFLQISLGSLNELESLIILSFELKYISKNVMDKYKVDIMKTGELIGGFKRYLCKKIK
jgi:four helix bundle protein